LKDYYYILGIDKAATTEQIKHAYRKLSNKFHPDKNDGDKFFEERFKEIQEAYETLSNLNRKKTYDSNFNNSNFKSNTHSGNSSYEEKIRKDFEDELRKRKKEYEEELNLKEKKHKEEIDDLKNQINRKRTFKNIAFISSKKRVTVALLFIIIAIVLVYLISNFYPLNNSKVIIDSTATTIALDQIPITKEKQLASIDPVPTDDSIDINSKLELTTINANIILSKKADEIKWQSIPNGISLTLLFNNDSSVLLNKFYEDYKEQWREFCFLDINGDSVPELLLSFYTGGAHCCQYYYIFRKINENTYAHTFSSTLGGEIEIFGNIIKGYL
jgi:DnaJ-domain-containing protein 1